MSQAQNGQPQDAPRTAPSPQPRRVRGGTRLHHHIDDLGRDLRSERWLALARRIGGENTFHLGLAYATAGQTTALDVLPGAIHADVQGVRRTPYRVRVRMRPCPDGEWQRALELVNGDASLFAEVLSHTISERCSEALERAGVPILPQWEENVEARCECSRGSACKHIAATLILMAERAAERSQDLLLVRGLSIQGFIDRLQQQRSIEARGAAPAHPEPRLDATAIAAPALEDTVQQFWTSPGAAMAAPRMSSRDAVVGRHVSHALLRRLGPPPLSGRFPMVGLLASIYDSVSERARAMVEE